MVPIYADSERFHFPHPRHPTCSLVIKRVIVGKPSRSARGKFTVRPDLSLFFRTQRLSVNSASSPASVYQCYPSALRCAPWHSLLAFSHVLPLGISPISSYAYLRVSSPSYPAIQSSTNDIVSASQPRYNNKPNNLQPVSPFSHCALFSLLTV